MTLHRRALLALPALAGLAGCGALSAATRASGPLDTYTLSPLAPRERPAAGRDHLVVELPTSAGELAGDRILIKPSPLQAQYLPDARWAEPAPAMLQSLLISSLLNTGRFRLVGRVGAGLSPDYTLMTELLSFQGEVTGRLPTSVQVRILLQMTLIREADRAIAGTRSFSSVGAVPSDSTAALIAGLDTGMQAILTDVVEWVRSAA